MASLALSCFFILMGFALCEHGPCCYFSISAGHACVVGYVCVGLLTCHALGHHVFCHDLMVGRTARFLIYAFSSFFIYFALISHLRVVLMKLWLHTHCLLLHLFFTI